MRQRHLLFLQLVHHTEHVERRKENVGQNGAVPARLQLGNELAAVPLAMGHQKAALFQCGRASQRELRALFGDQNLLFLIH